MAGRRGRRGAWFRWLLLAAVAALVAVGLWLVLDRSPQRPDLEELTGSEREPATETSPTDASPPSEETRGEEEVGEADEPATEEGEVDERSERRGPAGHLAIVVDDLGESVADVERLTEIGVPFSYAVLPYHPQTGETVALLRRRGAEILCHLPMQAIGGDDPGPGAITVGMSPQQVTRATRAALERVPGAVGVNNHMGSELTSRRAAMEAVLDVVAARDLFYLDSRTTTETIGYRMARRRGIPTAERHVFLDAAADVASIRDEFERLLEIAGTRGAAVAIAHPTPATMQVLEEEVPRALETGFNFVPVSFLLDRSTSFEDEAAAI